MPNQDQHIQLVSPVMDHIPGHVVDNSRCRTCDGISVRRTPCGPVHIKDRVPPNAVPEFITSQAKDMDPSAIVACKCDIPNQYPLVVRDKYKGKTVMICGSGPSLKKAARMIKRGETDHVWACNDSLMWLTQNGYRVTHGLAIDQSPDMYSSCWVPPPDVPYLLASSVDPKLIAHLEAHDRNDITLFHSFIGFPGEVEVYAMLYGKTTVSGEGLNAVNRAIGVAEWYGYDRILIAGADCAFTRSGDYLNFHVQGDKVEGLVLNGKVDGRTWHTKPDMLVSAISLVQVKKRLGSRLELVGDTLPHALRNKSQAFMDRCIRWASQDEMKEKQAKQNMARYAPRLNSSAINDLLMGRAVGPDPKAIKAEPIVAVATKQGLLKSEAFELVSNAT